MDIERSGQVHYVGHSMGGIILLTWLAFASPSIPLVEILMSIYAPGTSLDLYQGNRWTLTGVSRCITSGTRWGESSSTPGSPSRCATRYYPKPSNPRNRPQTPNPKP